jgi:hypothetical protein
MCGCVKGCVEEDDMVVAQRLSFFMLPDEGCVCVGVDAQLLLVSSTSDMGRRLFFLELLLPLVG